MLGPTADRIGSILVEEYTALHDQYAAIQAGTPSAGDDLYGLIWTVMHRPAVKAVEHLEPVIEHVPRSRVKYPVLSGTVMLLGWRDPRGDRQFGKSRSRRAALDAPVPGQIALLTEHSADVRVNPEPQDDTEAILAAAAAKNLDVVMIVVDSTAAQLDRIAWGIPRLDGARLVLDDEEVLYEASAMHPVNGTPVAPAISHSDGNIPERIVRRRSASGEQ